MTKAKTGDLFVWSYEQMKAHYVGVVVASSADTFQVFWVSSSDTESVQTYVHGSEHTLRGMKKINV